HVRDHHAVDRAAVDAQDRDPAALGGGRRIVVVGRTSAEYAVGQHDLPEVARALRAELEAVRGTAEPAIGHDHVFGDPAHAEEVARLQTERVVVGFDVAVGDAHAPAAVGID